MDKSTKRILLFHCIMEEKELSYGSQLHKDYALRLADQWIKEWEEMVNGPLREAC